MSTMLVDSSSVSIYDRVTEKTEGAVAWRPRLVSAVVGLAGRLLRTGIITAYIDRARLTGEACRMSLDPGSLSQSIIVTGIFRLVEEP